MKEILQHLARHGYSVLFASVFARQLCLPVPAILFLLAAGARYGTKALVIAKFVIGLDAIAPPLAGMSGTSLRRFVSFDGVGATLWASLYAGLGYVFYQQLDKAVDYAKRMGTFLTVVVLLLVAVMIGRGRSQNCGL